VSHAAVVDPEAPLRLEHHARIQTTLTKLVEAHRRGELVAPDEFVRTVLTCENVHVVTFAENYAAMRHRGDYESAGIRLVVWQDIAEEVRRVLWSRMLRGRVANASHFAP
jgi:hypothetical protein